MNIQTLFNDNQFMGLQHYHMDVRETRSAEIAFQTHEGDVVNLSFSSSNSIAGDVYKQSVGNEGTYQGFSLVARAASKYSLSINGELNEEELAAIEKFASKITPIAREFFSSEEARGGDLANSMIESHSAIQEASVKLEQTIKQTFSKSTNQSQSHRPDNGSQEGDATGQPEIRNTGALINSVVDTVFMNEVSKTKEVDVTRTTLRELLETFHEMIGEILVANRERENVAVVPETSAEKSDNESARDSDKESEGNVNTTVEE